jgi:hypothetical protein
MTTKTKPIRTLRDGAIKAAIWKNPSDNGHFYSVHFSRTYKDGEQLRDADSFSGTDLLKLAHLAGKAYDAIAKLRADDHVEEPQDQAA